MSSAGLADKGTGMCILGSEHRVFIWEPASTDYTLESFSLDMLYGGLQAEERLKTEEKKYQPTLSRR